MTNKERDYQKKLEAMLRSLEIKRKTKNMQAITGEAKLSSDYSKIHRRIIKSQEIYGEVIQLNRFHGLESNDYEEAC